MDTSHADNRRTYYRRTYVVHVLSEDPIPDDMDVADILAEADSGAYVAHWEDVVDRVLSAPETARALVRAGSDPGFFDLDDVDPGDVADLNREVTDAIFEAEHLDVNSRAAHARVSDLEEQLADSLPGDSVEGATARRGAVRAAIAAGDPDRAVALADRFALDGRRSSRIERRRR